MSCALPVAQMPAADCAMAAVCHQQSHPAALQSCADCGALRVLLTYQVVHFAERVPASTPHGT